MRFRPPLSSLPVALRVPCLDDDPLGGDRFGPLMPGVPAEAEAVPVGREPLSRGSRTIREVSAR